MKRIRDFFYNCNDIIAVLIILLAAATVIYWRVNIILDYPSTLAAESASSLSDSEKEVVMEVAEEDETEAEAGTEAGESKDAEESKDGGTEDATSKDAKAEDKDSKDQEAKEGEDASSNDEDAKGEDSNDEDSKDEESKDSDAKDGGLWKDGQLAEDIYIAIEPGSSYEAVDSLIAAGLFDSYEEYETLCSQEGIAPEAIQAMEFTLPAGSTPEEVLRIITNH